MKMRQKQMKDENFPVTGFLVRRDLRPLVALYYKFARYADDIADNPRLKPEAKIKKLHELEEIFDGKQEYKGKRLAFVLRLREAFLQENLDFSLVTDLLIAFRKDAMGFRYETWGQLVAYCTYSAAPVGRFLLALYNENPASYLPAASLCAALQIVNHLQDIKYDAKVLKRVYLPEEFLERFGVGQKSLTAERASEGLRQTVLLMLDLVLGQLREAELLLSIVNSPRLRLEIAVIISLTNIMIRKLKRQDILKTEVKLTFLDKLLGLAGGILLFVSRQRKTLPGN